MADVGRVYRRDVAVRRPYTEHTAPANSGGQLTADPEGYNRQPKSNARRLLAGLLKGFAVCYAGACWLLVTVAAYGWVSLAPFLAPVVRSWTANPPEPLPDAVLKADKFVVPFGTWGLLAWAMGLLLLVGFLLVGSSHGTANVVCLIPLRDALGPTAHALMAIGSVGILIRTLVPLAAGVARDGLPASAIAVAVAAVAAISGGLGLGAYLASREEGVTPSCPRRRKVYFERIPQGRRRSY